MPAAVRGAREYRRSPGQGPAPRLRAAAPRRRPARRQAARRASATAVAAEARARRRRGRSLAARRVGRRAGHRPSRRSGWSPPSAPASTARFGRAGLPAQDRRSCRAPRRWPPPTSSRPPASTASAADPGPRPRRPRASASSRSAGSRSARVVRLLPDTLVIAVDRAPPAGGLAARRPRRGDRRPRPVDPRGRSRRASPTCRWWWATGANAAAADHPAADASARPRLMARLDALVRVDDRRWDLRLKDGALIQLAGRRARTRR